MQGSFVRKRGTTWTAYYYLQDSDGNRRQRSKGGFETKRAAQAYLHSTVDAIRNAAYVEPAKITVGDYLVNRWLPTMESVLRPSTWQSYRHQMRLHVIPALGGVHLQRLSADQLDRLYRSLLQGGPDDRRPLSTKTVRNIHNALHKALRDAVRKGLIAKNVAEYADPPKLRQAGSQAMKTWTADELRKFLSAIKGHRLEAAYILSATTGMRRGEVLGLRWRDVDFHNRRVSVRQTILLVNYVVTYGTPKTARGRRSIAVDAFTVAALQEHRTRQQEERNQLQGEYLDSDLVFATVAGNPINPDLFSQTFDRTVAKLSIPRIRLHDLRHTHATLGLAAKVPPKVMSDRLGHATVAFTQDVYTHAIPQLETEIADKMGDLIFGTDAGHQAADERG